MSDYPRMLYHGDGSTAVVHDEDQEAELGSGWGREPSAVHRDEAATALHPPPSGPPSAIEIRHIIREELAALFGSFGPSEDKPEPEPEPEAEAVPRRRGRPPGSRNQQPAATGEED